MDMKKLIIVVIVLIIGNINSFSQVSINLDQSLPDPSAMLDVKSSSKGFLPPRMTMEQMNSIISPSDGLLVYNTSLSSLYWYDGSGWRRFNDVSFLEVDPVFGASAASGITISVMNNWNNAYNYRITNAESTSPLTLSISNHELLGSVLQATSSSAGYLTSADWNAFNVKISSQWITNKNNITYGQGNVGIGIDPGQKLTVGGIIQSATGGFMFPDGTIQITASSMNNVHAVGETFGGGIVFYVYDNGRHGLIAATLDQSFGIQWYNGTYSVTGASGDGLNAGEMNTAIIIATQISDDQNGGFAAKVCADYSFTMGGITYGDWYLPSLHELYLLYQQKNDVGGFSYGDYWSSTENNAGEAWSIYFYDGFQSSYSKNGNANVRPVRAF